MSGVSLAESMAMKAILAVLLSRELGNTASKEEFDRLKATLEARVREVLSSMQQIGAGDMEAERENAKAIASQVFGVIGFGPKP